MVLVDAHLFGDEGIFAQVLIFAVHRQDEFGLGQRHHQLLLVLAGVAGDVHVVHLLINDLRAQLHQLVDDAVDKLLVARDGARRDDDKVVWRDLDLTVLAHRHAA